MFRSRTPANPLLYLGVACELALLLVMLYVEPVARVFGFAPLELRHWLLLSAYPLVIVALEELRKLLARRARVADETPGGAALARS